MTSTALGTYELTIEATDGTLTHTAVATLVVQPGPGWSLSGSPMPSYVAPGSGWTGAPAGSTPAAQGAGSTPAAPGTTSTSATQGTDSTSTSPEAGPPTDTKVSGSTTVPPPAPPTTSTSTFPITADASGELYPGAPAMPLDLSLTNPTGVSISVTSLAVTLKSITLAAHPAAPGTCTASDFQVEQFSGPLPFNLGAGDTATLSALGFSPTQMPHIAMLDQPYDQNGCQGATLNLSYAGTATS